MKAGYLVFILFSFGAVLAQDIDSPVTCSASNPYLDHLRVSIELYDTPLKMDNHCEGEWDVYGSCCNPDTLINHQKRDAELITAALKSVNINLMKFKESLEAVQLYIMQESVMPLDQSDPLINEYQSKADHMASSSKFNSYFSFVTSLSKEEFDGFLAQNTACWQEMIRARSASLCSTCSARSHLFFDGQRGLISEDYCSSILQKCAAPLKILLNLAVGIHEFHPLLTQLAEVGIESNLISHLSDTSSDEYTKAIKSSHILEAIKSFSSTSTPSVGAKLVLCGSFLHLASKTFIEYISNLFHGTIEPSTIKQQPVLKVHIMKHIKRIIYAILKRYSRQHHRKHWMRAMKLKLHNELIRARKMNMPSIQPIIYRSFQPIQAAKLRSFRTPKPALKLNIPRRFGKWGNRRKLAASVLEKTARNIAKASPNAKTSLNTNWVNPSPLFNFDPSPNPLLHGDVLIVPPQVPDPKANTDSSYTSYYGAIGTTPIHGSGKVFNLSKHFP